MTQLQTAGRSNVSSKGLGTQHSDDSDSLFPCKQLVAGVVEHFFIASYGDQVSLIKLIYVCRPIYVSFETCMHYTFIALITYTCNHYSGMLRQPRTVLRELLLSLINLQFAHPPCSYLNSGAVLLRERSSARAPVRVHVIVSSVYGSEKWRSHQVSSAQTDKGRSMEV